MPITNSQLQQYLADYATITYVDGIVNLAFRPAGSWDSSGNTFPTVGTGLGGIVKAGDVYNTIVAGTPTGFQFLDVGDNFYPIVDNPAQNPANWAKFAVNTTQATEVSRGTLRIATQATIEDDTTTNDIDAVTPKKWWQGFNKAITISSFFSATRNTTLAGLNTALNGVITSGNSIVVAFGKIQNALTANKKTIGITFGWLTPTTLADSTTYYIGGLMAFGAVTSDSANRRLRAPLTGNCNKLYFTYQTNAPASTTGCTFRLHNLTQSTNVVITTVQSLGAQANVLLTGFSLACNENDQMQLQIDVPILATNPISTVMTGNLIFENT